MNIKTATIGLAVTALVLGSAGGALAQPVPPQVNPGCNCMQMLDGSFTPAPAITDEQKAEMQTMFEAHWQALQPKEQDLRAKYLELNALSGNSNAQPEYISSLSASIVALEAELQQARMAFAEELNDKFDFAGHFGHVMGMNGGQMRVFTQMAPGGGQTRTWMHHPETGRMLPQGTPNQPSTTGRHHQYRHNGMMR